MFPGRELFQRSFRDNRGYATTLSGEDFLPPVLHQFNVINPPYCALNGVPTSRVCRGRLCSSQVSHGKSNGLPTAREGRSASAAAAAAAVLQSAVSGTSTAIVSHLGLPLDTEVCTTLGPQGGLNDSEKPSRTNCWIGRETYPRRTTAVGWDLCLLMWCHPGTDEWTSLCFLLSSIFSP